MAINDETKGQCDFEQEALVHIGRLLKMERTISVENIFRDVINKDIESSFGAEGDRRVDPLGGSGLSVLLNEKQY